MRLSNKLLGLGYVKECLCLKSSLRKFYGRYGDLTKQYEVPLSRMLHDILDDDHIQWKTPLIGHYTNFWPLLIWTLLPNLTFYLIVQGFHRTCNGCGMSTEDAYSSGNLVLFHFGTCMCSNVETNLSWTCLRTFEFRTSLGTSLLRPPPIERWTHLWGTTGDFRILITRSLSCELHLYWCETQSSRPQCPLWYKPLCQTYLVNNQ